MSISSASHTPVMPLQTHWTSQDLADAVPLRLSELLDFDADRDIGTERASANTVTSRHAPRPESFARNTTLPFFRIR